jgi:hypothetical protein
MANNQHSSIYDDAIDAITSSAKREEWRKTYFNKNLFEHGAKISVPSDTSPLGTGAAALIAGIAPIVKDTVDWTKFIGDVLSGKRSYTPEDVTMWSMGALGGSSFGRTPKGSLKMGLAKEFDKFADISGLIGDKTEASNIRARESMRELTSAEGKELDDLLSTLDDALENSDTTPTGLAKKLGLKYQGEWKDFGLMEFFDETTKGNITVKSLDELEGRVIQLRNSFKEEL